MQSVSSRIWTRAAVSISYDDNDYTTGTSIQQWLIGHKTNPNQTKEYYYSLKLGTSGGVMVSKLDSQTYTSEFESHWVPHSFGLVLNRSKDLRKLLLQLKTCTRSWVTELELSTLVNQIKGSVQSSAWAPEFDMKHLKKAVGRTSQIVVKIAMKMKTMVWIL